MKQLEQDVSLPPRQREGCDHRVNRTVYIHFCSGEVEEVTGVLAHRVSNDHIVIEIDNGDLMIIPRRDVYFISCDHMSPPPMQ
ncbi:MAG TPA: hypothetical protein VFY10_15580 [Dehalococcoidia bacterium]|nr:hypothetical protein [Dehalococcoidia bacterium]